MICIVLTNHAAVSDPAICRLNVSDVLMSGEMSSVSRYQKYCVGELIYNDQFRNDNRFSGSKLIFEHTLHSRLMPLPSLAGGHADHGKGLWKLYQITTNFIIKHTSPRLAGDDTNQPTFMK